MAILRLLSIVLIVCGFFPSANLEGYAFADEIAVDIDSIPIPNEDIPKSCDLIRGMPPLKMKKGSPMLERIASFWFKDKYRLFQGRAIQGISDGFVNARGASTRDYRDLPDAVIQVTGFQFSTPDETGRAYEALTSIFQDRSHEIMQGGTFVIGLAAVETVSEQCKGEFAQVLERRILAFNKNKKAASPRPAP